VTNPDRRLCAPKSPCSPASAARRLTMVATEPGAGQGRSDLSRCGVRSLVPESLRPPARPFGRSDLAAPAPAAGEAEAEQGAIAQVLQGVVAGASIASNSERVMAVFLVGRSPRLTAAR
jgi:hypothetical protein